MLHALRTSYRQALLDTKSPSPGPRGLPVVYFRLYWFSPPHVEPSAPTPSPGWYLTYAHLHNEQTLEVTPFWQADPHLDPPSPLLWHLNDLTENLPDTFRPLTEPPLPGYTCHTILLQNKDAPIWWPANSNTCLQPETWPHWPPSPTPESITPNDSFVQNTLSSAQHLRAILGHQEWDTLTTHYHLETTCPDRVKRGPHVPDLIDALCDNPYPGPECTAFKSVGTCYFSLALALQWDYIKAHDPPSLRAVYPNISPYHAQRPSPPPFSPNTWQTVTSHLPPADSDTWRLQDDPPPLTPHMCLCGNPFPTDHCHPAPLTTQASKLNPAWE